MQAIAAMAVAWLAQRRTAAIARVVEAAGLGPRPSGDIVIIDAEGRSAGTLLAGVANVELVDVVAGLLESGAVHQILRLEIDSGDATAAGLTCGGTVEILVQRLDAVPERLWERLAAGRPAALVTLLGTQTPPVVILPDGELSGTLGSSGFDALAQSEAEPMLTHPGPSTSRVRFGELEFVIEGWNAEPRLVIVGASDLSRALTRQVELLGWTAVTVVGADQALAAVDQLSVSDMVVVIDHDPFVATPVLAVALRRGLGYVGALGSRRTQALRREHLGDVGLRRTEIERLHGPTGLDIGAHTPAETAVSIVAEIIATRSARSGAPLTTTTTRISG